ncbi:hypothetical protein PAL_GLEAN10000524 [Pteropus alecto]|uniref:Uncharacterized protein n=1 Tax=Pteropus alecto TaxID=9402 RepID=L5K3G6_PTEAL|nr:hypothetical protein PAL_GLEAN10000524 [Pteropus alecto]
MQTGNIRPLFSKLLQIQGLDLGRWFLGSERRSGHGPTYEFGRDTDCTSYQGSVMHVVMKAATAFLKSSENHAIFAL